MHYDGMVDAGRYGQRSTKPMMACVVDGIGNTETIHSINLVVLLPEGVL